MAIQSRKEFRKQQRQEKKQRKKEYYQGKDIPEPTEKVKKNQPMRIDAKADALVATEQKNVKVPIKRHGSDLSKLEDKTEQFKPKRSKLRKIAQGMIDNDFIDFLEEMEGDKPMQATSPDDEFEDEEKNDSEGIIDISEEDENGEEVRQKIEEAKSKSIEQFDQASAFKKIKSLFNKLSEGNIAIMFRELLECMDSTQIGDYICIIIKAFIETSMNSTNPIVIQGVTCGLISGLHRAIGDDLMHKLMNEVYLKAKEFEMSFAVIITFMYMYGSINHSLLFEYIEETIVSGCDENHVSMVLHILRYAGFELRKEDPDKLKKLINISKESKDSQRLKFMLEELDDIKNNKKKVDLFEKFLPILNWIQFEPSIKGIKAPRLIIDYGKLKNSGTNPNWYKVSMQAFGAVKKTDEQKKLEDIANKLHLKTDIKKSIFYCLTTSFDAIEAVQKLHSLKLSPVQQREIVRVVLYMGNYEKQFNPFYAEVIASLCKSDTKHKYSIQFALWDHIRLLPTYPKRIILNIAQTILALISEGIVSLGILKIINILNAHAHQRMLLRYILIKILAL